MDSESQNRLRALIEACIRGEDSAYETLYREWSSDVYTMVVRLSRRQTDAEEITQEVFLSVFRALPRFRFESSFRTWVYRIAMRRVADWYRKKDNISANRISLDVEISDIEPLHQGKSVTPREYSEQSQIEEKTEAALQLISEPYRSTLVLRYVQGLDYQQIADVMSCRIGTIKSRINRGHTMMEEALRNVGLQHPDEPTGENE